VRLVAEAMDLRLLAFCKSNLSQVPRMQDFASMSRILVTFVAIQGAEGCTHPDLSTACDLSVVIFDTSIPVELEGFTDWEKQIGLQRPLVFPEGPPSTVYGNWLSLCDTCWQIHSKSDTLWRPRFESQNLNVL
jgi:hypothetical protein